MVIEVIVIAAVVVIVKVGRGGEVVGKEGASATEVGVVVRRSTSNISSSK